MGIRKAILSTKDAAHAPYNSITLPKTFKLDSFDFEDDLHNLNRIEDTNLKNNEDITLQDEIPVREDPILIGEDVDEPEFMLDVVHDHHDPLWDDHVMDPDDDLEELMTMTDNGTANLEVEEMSENEEPPSVISADQVQEFTINPHDISFGHQSADHLVLQSTPKRMRKRRKLLIDAETQLESNMQLGTLKRRRKNALLFFLMNRSKLNKKSRKDGMSFEPLLNGLCDDLRNICKEDIVSTKLKMASSQAEEEQDHAEPSDGYSPPPGNDINLLSTDDFTPSTCYKEDTIMSDIHEFDSSAEDLSFLDQEDRTPFGEQGGTTAFDTLPLRTRTVARFLQEKSPISEDLNLNTILQGKNKKMCVRMFYETLVLKNCGLVNVSQNESYGDITLKVTSRLKEQLSTSSF
ncbi:sister chromatid cohesion 1 protein 3-like [Solanum pennellii]|uniref:Sister chromatid cohesion 1 protein 3-like n=1 Tax=Solanum pennellii TaxID=28526 RepID=A0ABM1G217_SOLPN|nr:sister chromatid cohesion 1 protein 3-like [Solanum pennellii]